MSVGKGSIARATASKKPVEKAVNTEPVKEAPKKAAPAKKAAPKPQVKKAVGTVKKAERPDNLRVTNTIYEVGQELPIYLM